MDLKFKIGSAEAIQDEPISNGSVLVDKEGVAYLDTDENRITIGQKQINQLKSEIVPIQKSITYAQGEAVNYIEINDVSTIPHYVDIQHTEYQSGALVVSSNNLLSPVSAKVEVDEDFSYEYDPINGILTLKGKVTSEKLTNKFEGLSFNLPPEQAYYRLAYWCNTDISADNFKAFNIGIYYKNSEDNNVALVTIINSNNNITKDTIYSLSISNTPPEDKPCFLGLYINPKETIDFKDGVQFTILFLKETSQVTTTDKSDFIKPMAKKYLNTTKVLSVPTNMVIRAQNTEIQKIIYNPNNWDSIEGSAYAKAQVVLMPDQSTGEDYILTIDNGVVKPIKAYANN